MNNYRQWRLFCGNLISRLSFLWIPRTDALLFVGQALDINFAHAGHIGPWARPQIASQEQYDTIESTNPERHIETEAVLRQTDIKTVGEENILSK